MVAALRQCEVLYVHRCVPALPEELQKDLYGAAASYVSSSSTKLTSLSSSLNTNSQRLRRYISDINRGKWLIIASGEFIVLAHHMIEQIMQSCAGFLRHHHVCYTPSATEKGMSTPAALLHSNALLAMKCGQLLL